jgi:hypothetical protein
MSRGNEPVRDSLGDHWQRILCRQDGQVNECRESWYGVRPVVGEKVRRERRWTSAGVSPARERPGASGEIRTLKHLFLSRLLFQFTHAGTLVHREGFEPPGSDGRITRQSVRVRPKGGRAMSCGVKALGVQGLNTLGWRLRLPITAFLANFWIVETES